MSKLSLLEAFKLPLFGIPNEESQVGEDGTSRSAQSGESEVIKPPAEALQSERRGRVERRRREEAHAVIYDALVQVGRAVFFSRGLCSADLDDRVMFAIDSLARNKRLKRDDFTTDRQVLNYLRSVMKSKANDVSRERKRLRETPGDAHGSNGDLPGWFDRG